MSFELSELAVLSNYPVFVCQFEFIAFVESTNIEANNSINAHAMTMSVTMTSLQQTTFLNNSVSFTIINRLTSD